jgi:hypothetical protein
MQKRILYSLCQNQDYKIVTNASSRDRHSRDGAIASVGSVQRGGRRESKLMSNVFQSLAHLSIKSPFAVIPAKAGIQAKTYGI